MEPLDYLKVLQRHWKPALALVLVALTLVFITSPKEASKVYEASTIVIRNSTSSAGGGGGGGVAATDNVDVVALQVRSGEVPVRVDEALNYDGTPEQLVKDIEVVADPTVNTVEITATAGNADRAALLANTFAKQIIAYIDDKEEDRLQTEREARAARIASINKQIEDLQSQIDPSAPDPSLVGQIDGLGGQIAAATTEGATSQKTVYATLSEATTGTLQDQFVAGATRTQRMILAGAVAALLAFGVAIMLDRADSRLHNKAQTERQFGLPVLAEVPLLAVRSRHRAAVYGYQNDARVAEAYRSVRTALMLYRDRLPLELEAAELAGQQLGRPGASPARQVILVTSPEAGDGKSTTAANLALAYAEAGQRTLLVNWDLWRPLSGRIFDAEDGPGVSEFLEAGSASLQRFVQNTSIPGLQLMAAGLSDHQPGGQLDTELRLLEEARTMADVVIIDTAPILSTSVTRELVTMADVVILACRAGRTTSPAAERCSELLERLGAPTLGVVLVGVPTGPFGDYYPSSPPKRQRSRDTSLPRPGAGEFEPAGVRERPEPNGGRHYRAGGRGDERGYSP